MSLVENYEKHTRWIHIDGGASDDDEEYMRYTEVEHYLHSSIEKSLTDRVNKLVFQDRLNCLTITIHVLKMNMVYYMSKIGYNSMFSVQ